MSRLAIEVRVGAFVLAALAVLVGFVMALGDFSLTPGVVVHADFAFTSGLQVGAPVMVSGVRVGRVTGLALLQPDSQPPAATSRRGLGQGSPALVRADLDIDPEAMRLLSSDSLLHVGTQGVIGETYLELTPLPGAAVAAGAVLRGVDAPRLHVMVLQLSAVLQAIDALVGAVGSDVEVGELGHALAELLHNVGGVVAERRAELSQALADLAATAADTRALVAQVRLATRDGQSVAALLDDGGATLAQLRQELPPLLQEARAGIAALQSLSSKADAAVDPEAIAQLLTDVRRAAGRLDTLTAGAEKILGKLQRGEGSVGGLLQDPQIYDDVKEMLRDLKRNPWKFLWRD